MTVRQIQHPAGWPVYDDEARARVQELIADGRSFDYAYGAELADLESDFAREHDRRHALALTSGTAGLFAAYFALGIGAGDEVVVPDYTFFSTATPLFLLGAVPVLCDVGSDTGVVTAAGIEELITERTKAVVVTHLWGHPCEMDAISAVARRRGLALIEDASHAHGATYRGRRVGGFGDISIFSCGGQKLVSGGLGGMLLTDSGDVFARACLMTNFRHRTDLTVEQPGYEPFLLTGLGGNFRMSPVAAVLAHSHLRRLDELVTRRATNLAALTAAFTRAPGIEPVPPAPGCTTGAAYESVLEVTPDGVLSRDRLVELLKAEGLDVRAPAARPLHTYPIFQGAGPGWSAATSAAVSAAWVRNDRPFPGSDERFARWMRLPVNHLWDDGSIVGPYIEAFDRVMAATAA